MVDSRNAANIDFENVAVGADALIGEEGKGADVLGPRRSTSPASVSAPKCSAAPRNAFERTVQYLKEREQFGVPIGSFQALKHRAANMFCEIELSKSCVLEALTALDEARDPGGDRQAREPGQGEGGRDLPHRLPAKASRCTGGIGMTDEFDIGFFIKRAAVTEQTFGDVHFHRNRYGELEGY